MRHHNESQDTFVSERSDVMMETGPVELTRRQMRLAETASHATETHTAELDPVSVSKLVAEVVSVADAAIAERVERQLQQLRASIAPAPAPASASAQAPSALPVETAVFAATHEAMSAPAPVVAPAPLKRERIRTVSETPAVPPRPLTVVEALANTAARAAAAPIAPVAPFATVAPVALASAMSLPIPAMSVDSFLAEKIAPTSRKSSRQAHVPSVATRHPVPPRSAPPRGISAGNKRPHWRRRATARFLTATAMLFVAGIAVATSVPANALLSAQDVENMNVAQSKDVVTAIQDGQTIEASGSSVAAGRDGVSVSGAEPVKAYTDSSSNRITPFVPESSNPILWPFPSAVPLTDGFGTRANFWTWGGWTGNFHSGQDFDPGYGTPIRSVADGIVVEVSSSLCGQAVVVSHNIKGEKFDSEYCHMIYGSPNVTVGQSIMAGTILGNVGQTGMATGPHLHLEIHIAGNAIDPVGFLRARSTEW